jgi:hypothetical protein
MWIVRLVEQGSLYGPFEDGDLAHAFARFLTAEVDPAEVKQLNSPTLALLNWRDHVKAGEA